MGGWSSGVSVGVDVGGISNPLIASFFFFPSASIKQKGADAVDMCSPQFLPLIYLFSHFSV